jgi:competence protein ComEC
MKRVNPGLFLAVLLVGLACRTPVSDEPIDMTFIDVGQGSSILIRTSDQRTCLIDAGPAFAGANEVCPLLDSLHITELDYCITTNYTDGRVGGMDEVLRWLGGEEGVLYRCFDRGAAPDVPGFADYAAVAGSRRTRMRLGELIDMGDVSVWCIAANGRTLGKTQPVADERDKSIALLVSFGEFDMLVSSDLTSLAGAGRRNVGAGLTSAADEVEMLVVGDFGRTGAVGQHLADALNPVVSVIPAGLNDDSLPSQRTVNLLCRRDGRVYQTGRSGWNMIPHGKGRIVGGNIHVTVGRDYYVVAGDTFRTFR